MSMRCTRALTVPLTLLAIFMVAADGWAEVATPADGPPEVGRVVADFTLRDLDGEPHNLADQRDTGPVVLVFFRGAW
jgi:cytochrome oxidase Cu insertion factor (SCO1/SenC/PrrC family)